MAIRKRPVPLENDLRKRAGGRQNEREASEVAQGENVRRMAGGQTEGNGKRKRKGEGGGGEPKTGRGQKTPAKENVPGEVRQMADAERVGRAAYGGKNGTRGETKT